jgi:hypothetical protein
MREGREKKESVTARRCSLFGPSFDLVHCSGSNPLCCFLSKENQPGDPSQRGGKATKQKATKPGS